MKSKLVLVTGIFDILHPGHIRLLRFAKNCGDRLIVGIYGDNISNNIINSQELRKESVEALEFVAESIIITSNLRNEILSLKPDVVVKGREHQGKYNEEEEILAEIGGELIFSSGDVGSTHNLVNLQKQVVQYNYLQQCSSIMERHKISNEKLISIINKFSEKKVCVLGDLIIDEYIECFPMGMSQEEPIIALKPLSSKKFIGGASIVAAHASALGSQAMLYSVTGEDENKDFSANKLAESKVDFNFIVDKNRPTSLKKRYRCDERTFFKVSELSQQSISEQSQKALLEKLKIIIPKVDILIFSDFSYGFLPEVFVAEIIKIGQQNNVFMAADSQSSSQTGDLSKFNYMNLITPTEREARITLRNNEDGLVVIANKLLEVTNSRNILLKLGADGFLAHNPNLRGTITEQIVALNKNPIDVSGAGDSLLTAASLAMNSGATLWEAAIIGAVAASIQTDRVGNIPISSEELIGRIKR